MASTLDPSQVVAQPPFSMRQAARWAVTCGVVASAAAILVHGIGPPALDAPAHLFQTWTLARRGFAIWDNFWYAGSYEYTPYSLLYYPLAMVAGIVPLAVASAGVLGMSFAFVSVLEWGPRVRLPSLLFSASASILMMVAGLYPFLTGAALASLGLVAVKRHRPWAAAASIMATAAMSPLAFLLLAVVLLAGVLSAPRPLQSIRRHRTEGVAVVLVAAGGVLEGLTFHQSGLYPFSVVDFACVASFAVAGLYLRAGRPRGDLLRNVFLVYLGTNMALFLWPGAVGSNAGRLFAIAGTPLLWIAAVTGPRPRSARVLVGVLTAAFVIQTAPYAVSAYRAYESEASASPSFWRPAIRFLQSHPDRGFRAEVVATATHWEAYYLPRAGVPLARGWYRQDDFPGNRILYSPRIGPRAYQRWLRSLGVRYVLLPLNVPLDYSSVAESRLLESGRSGLVPVGRGPNWAFYELPHATPIASGPRPGDTTRISISQSTIHFDARVAGRYVVRVHTSPYWQLSGPGCIAAAQGAMLTLEVAGPGPIRLVMPGALSTVTALLDADHRCAASQGQSVLDAS